MKTAILSFKIDGTCLFTSLEFVEMDIYTLLEHFLILETGSFLDLCPKSPNSSFLRRSGWVIWPKTEKFFITFWTASWM